MEQSKAQEIKDKIAEQISIVGTNHLRACSAHDLAVLAQIFVDVMKEQEEAKYNAPAMKALHDLTPGGSEFVVDIKRCVDWIRERFKTQHEKILSQQKELKELRERKI